MRIRQIYIFMVAVFTGLMIQAALALPALATTYESQGIATSTNLLTTSPALSLDSFYYNIDAIPGDSSVRIQFSKDNSNWYSSAGELSAWTTLTATGGANLSLTAFVTASSWTSGNAFYYKIELNSTTDFTQTPTIEDIRLDYTPLAGSGGFVFDNSGNVGIGTFSPAARLSVIGTETGASQLVSFSNGNGDNVFSMLSNGNLGIGDATPATLFTVGNGDLFQVNSSGAIAAIAGYTQGSGNFAISGAGTFGTGTGAVSLNGDTTITGTKTLTVTGGLTSLGGNLSFTGAAPAISASTAATDISLDAGTTGKVKIGGTSTGDIEFAGGSGSTGCTITTAGVLTCSGNIIGPTAGTIGYWSRAGVSLSQGTANDNLTLGSGTITTTGTISSGLINSQTISSSASFTGTVTAATSFLAPTIDSVTGVALDIGTATQTALTIGRAGAATTINGSGLTVGPTAWTATPTISGLVAMTSGFDSNAASTVAGLTVDGNGNLAVSSGTGTFSMAGYSGTGNAASITSSSTTDLNKALNISQTGATAGTDYGLYVANTGAATTNIGGYFTASGATNNYGLIVENGNVGIGTSNPAIRLEVLENTSATAQMRLISDGSNYAEFYVDSTGDLSIDLTGSGGDDIRVLDQNMRICAGGSFGSVSCPTTGFTISGNGNLVVENKVVADSFERICAAGYIWVPGAAKFGTMPGFCVMKYEAKGTTGAVVSTSTGLPYVSISQESARAECKGIGTGYHLISENEWMTIAENIANTAINDLDSDAGLQLATGHSDNADAGAASNAVALIDAADPIVTGCNLSLDMENAANAYDADCEIRGDSSNGADPGDANDKGFYDTGQDWADGTYSSGANNKAQLRTHVLSNGNVIWDISGNVWEWTDALVIGQEEPEDASPANEWLQYTGITKYKGLGYIRPPDDGWSSANGIGQLYTYVGSGSTNTYAFGRGGNWSDGAYDGVFALVLNSAPSSVYTNLGFRCSR